MPPKAKQNPSPPTTRRRKPHRKSRLGCSNCKLRSVKCDETKPTCARCLASGFTCNYSRSGVPALQLAHSGASKLDLARRLRAPPSPPRLRIPVAGPVRGRVGEYEMREWEFAALERFRQRTSLTVGTERTRHLYRDGAWELGLTNPFLLHVFLAFSLLHDTHLCPLPPPPSLTKSLAFHWYHGTALFKQQLTKPNLSPSERDALWASAALLGAAAFAFMDGHHPREAWPLREPGPNDLDWLKMSDGKKVVWAIADPTRPESLFHPLVEETIRWSVPDGCAPIAPDALPTQFYSLFDLTSPTPESNPYHVAASIVAQILPIRISDDNILIFLTFISQIDPRYKLLLEEKDPRAMLLLAWWYAKTADHSAWWLQRRSVLEGLAICIYLERECGDDPRILELVAFPKRMFESVVLGQGAMSHEVLSPSDSRVSLPIR